MESLSQKCTQIDFFYWADQCPYNSIIRKLLIPLKNDSQYSIHTYNLSNHPQLAKKLNIYSPTLLVFNNRVRWNGSITKNIIEKISKGDIPERKAYVVNNGKDLISGITKPLTEKTILETYKPCGCSKKSSCIEKAIWIKYLRNKYRIPHLGILHYFQGVCVGGAEFVPSLAVPYSIPKREDIAFLTCSFLSDDKADFRSLPLQALEDELPSYGFKYLIAIASEEVVFPNGTLQWFIDRGYVDLGQIYYEERDFARMHLIKKNL
ncbi:MAG: hypothetical protein KAX49_02695 [Halanaerobiales bacterium]|nr:hypothetical protein [Halanaerobiales bacterium]